MVAINEARANSNTSIDYPRQFEVFFVDLPEIVGAKHCQRGVHPCVVLSSNANNKNNSNITVIPITSKNSKGRHLPTHLFLNIDAAKTIGLYKASTIQGECVMPVDKSMLKKKVGKVTSPDMKAAIKHIINAYIGFLYTA